VDAKDKFNYIAEKLKKISEDSSYLKDKVYKLEKKTQMTSNELKGCVEGLSKQIEDSKTQTENSVLNLLVDMEKKISETHQVIVLSNSGNRLKLVKS